MRHLLLLLIALSAAFAWQTARPRLVTNEDFSKHRPAPTATGHPSLGFSLWRMRPSTPTDRVRTRGFDHRKSAPTNQDATPELFHPSATLTEGEDFRFTFESARPGYLYVIDQDVFRDGNLSKPRLIFPTQALNSGQNKIAPGFLIGIPAWKDQPSFFDITLAQPSQTAIRLTLIHTPKPIPNLTTTEESQFLPAQTFNSWLALWAKRTTLLPQLTLTARPFSPAEESADRGNRPLSNADSAPNTVFTCQTCSPTDWILAQIQFKVRARGR